jgi:UDP-N-acetylmuramate-alanine ligase
MTAKRYFLKEVRLIACPPEVSANLEDVQCVVISPAVPTHHPVVRAARRTGIDVVLRSKMLAQLIRGRSAICVAGSHSKSTTTAMLMHIMKEASLPYGHMLGDTFSEMPSAHLHTTHSPFILEVCEAHGALSDWNPSHAIVTNIGDEHASQYVGIQGLKTDSTRSLSL